LNGIMVAAMVRKDLAVADLRHQFWEHLGYEDGAAASTGFDRVAL
jgi:hypothetical protein